MCLYSFGLALRFLFPPLREEHSSQQAFAALAFAATCFPKGAFFGPFLRLKIRTSTFPGLRCYSAGWGKVGRTSPGGGQGRQERRRGKKFGMGFTLRRRKERGGGGILILICIFPFPAHVVLAAETDLLPLPPSLPPPD